MRMEVGVALLLKNPVNPFMHADVHALYEGTNSTQISWVEEHVNKNIQALYVLLPLYILCTYKGLKGGFTRSLSLVYLFAWLDIYNNEWRTSYKLKYF